MEWKKGDIAICVKTGRVGGYEHFADNSDWPRLRLNAEYVVANVYKCPKCNNTSLDVGFYAQSGLGTSCGCRELIPCRDIHWCSSMRFVKKDIRSKEEKLEEAILKEDYEAAGILVKEINKV